MRRQSALENRPTIPPIPVTPVTVTQKPSGALPFDQDLAEAMRQAQVSLFALPRPPAGEEILSSPKARDHRSGDRQID